MITGRIVDLSHKLYPGKEEYHLRLKTHNTADLYPQYPVGYIKVLTSPIDSTSSNINAHGLSKVVAILATTLLPELVMVKKMGIVTSEKRKRSTRNHR